MCSLTFVRSFLQRSGYASSQTSFCILALILLRQKGQEYENSMVALFGCKVSVISVFDSTLYIKKRRLHNEIILF